MLEAKTVMDAARGKWRGILSQLGVPHTYLTGSHGPCPIERGGRDRFRFDNKGEGMWFCSTCGAGDGFKLLQKVNGWTFPQAVQAVAEAAGGVRQSDPPQRSMDEETRLRILRELWVSSTQIHGGDPADVYLSNALGGNDCGRWLLSSLRNCRECPVSGVHGVTHLPAILAPVHDPGGNIVTIHRTYISGGSKADIPSPRRMMPGKIPPGSCIRIHEPIGKALVVAEGVETALAGSFMHDTDCWSGIDAGRLARMEIPDHVEELIIMGDNDKGYAGQAAAYELARRQYSKRKVVLVEIPDKVGDDWRDVLCR